MAEPEAHLPGRKVVQLGPEAEMEQVRHAESEEEGEEGAAAQVVVESVVEVQVVEPLVAYTVGEAVSAAWSQAPSVVQMENIKS